MLIVVETTPNEMKDMSHEEQCEKINRHTDMRISRLEESEETIRRVIFGDRETQDMGMKEKVDKIYEILVQAKGYKGAVGLLVLMAAGFAIMKGFFAWVITK